MKKRSFDRGFLKGRLTLSREISAMCRYKNKVFAQNELNVSF